MADEATAVEGQAPDAPTTDTTTQAGTQPDATGKPSERVFTQAELETIVKERIQREQRKATEAADKARIDAERKAAEEQGQYQKLAESLKAELEAERLRAKGLEVAALRRDAATKHQLPAAFADRLRGETAEEIDADAQELVKALPKPTAPNINAGNAPAAAGQSYLGGLTPQEFGARFGVRPDLLGKQ